jgi:hypothetical protein
LPRRSGSAKVRAAAIPLIKARRLFSVESASECSPAARVAPQPIAFLAPAMIRAECLFPCDDI